MVEASRFGILHEDEHVLAFAKPSRVSFLADRRGDPSLWETLREALPGLRPLHRLDKGTSGVVLFAKSRACQTSLNRQFAAHSLHKYYVAVVRGHPASKAGQIDLPLVKGRKNTYRIAANRSDIRFQREGERGSWSVDPAAVLLKGGGFASRTVFRLVTTHGTHSLLCLMPRTGRTHQLRVHLGWIGHPILGDHLYGRGLSTRELSCRLALHAHRICWKDDYSDPSNIRDRSVSCPIPGDWPEWRKIE